MPAPSQTLKEKLNAGSCLLGSFVFSPDPGIPEVYAEAGFDFVIIDMEHALNDVRSVLAHLRSCAASGIGAVVRLGNATLADAPRLLDAGAEGIMLPHLGLPGSGAKEVLSSLRYWPSGTRPTCTGVPAAGFGLADFAATVARSNRDILSIGLIEDRECVEAIDEVLAGAGVDWVMPGPADLATSLGVHGQLRHPTVTAAVETSIAAARRRDIPVGVYINDPAEIAAWSGKGVRFFVHSIDYKILAKTLRATALDCRAQLKVTA